MDFFFFVGTEAELIKIFPVIMRCQERGCTCNLIASGQNDLKKNRILEYIHLNGKYIELSQESDIRKCTVGLFTWFLTTRKKAGKIIRQEFASVDMRGRVLVVHGDTVSTFMGALVGRQLQMRVCHVEAGLRSHHLFNPFPEEIDRLLTSRIARVHFAPGLGAAENLSRAKGQIINTRYNTIIDSLMVSKKMPVVTDSLETVLAQEYFVFVMHRQENLMNREFVKRVMKRIEQIAFRLKCVLVLHKITENILEEMGILTELRTNSDFILFRRVDYFDFMKLLDGACYVITDGGSNQEELYYMGKPCLIMRKTTERQEGIGKNAVLFDGNIERITSFGQEFYKYEISAIEPDESPSEMIAKQLMQVK